MGMFSWKGDSIGKKLRRFAERGVGLGGASRLGVDGVGARQDSGEARLLSSSDSGVVTVGGEKDGVSTGSGLSKAPVVDIRMLI